MGADGRRAKGTADVQGALWSARARDWAEAQEPLHCPMYEAVFAALAIGRGSRLLDVGCGAGLFCSLAASRGAVVAGIDASSGSIAIAKERVPHGDFRVGEMETLPYDDAAFDAVTGFNSFQFAATPTNALAEAKRVSRSGAPVVVATWGRPERCQTARFLEALKPLLPPPPPGAPGPFALSADGALEALVAAAGIRSREVIDVSCPFEYPDTESALRGLLSAGPSVRAIHASGETRVRDAVITSLEPFRRPGGGYRMENEFRVLIAMA